MNVSIVILESREWVGSNEIDMEDFYTYQFHSVLGEEDFYSMIKDKNYSMDMTSIKDSAGFERYKYSFHQIITKKEK